MEQINALMEKFNNFVDAELRSLAKPSDNSLIVTLAVQNDDFEDTDIIKIEFIDLKDARLLDNSMLSFLDMMSGITLIYERNLYGFALGHGDTMLHVKNAPLYIISTDIKIEEQAV